MDRYISSLLWCLLLAIYGRASAQQDNYQPDILGAPYECRKIVLPPDYSGPVEATLVRRQLDRHTRRAILYIHGYNDYFFQTALGDSIAQHGYNFYALDLRKYGRSLRPGQTAFECRDLREYQPEITAALEQMHQEGQQEVYLMAHSTGCLISALYLHDTANKAGVRGLILNSPFIDFQSTAFNEHFLLPLVTSLAWIAPRLTIIPPSKTDNAYSRSLMAEHHGKWHFRTDWKMPRGYPITASWLRAIKRGHRRVRAGLDLQLPILMMTSDASLLPEKQWEDRYAQVDLVLDVEDMWRYGRQLGHNLELIKIHHGLHDLFLSSDPEAYRSAYRELFDWLARQAAESSRAGVVGPIEEVPGDKLPPMVYSQEKIQHQ